MENIMLKSYLKVMKALADGNRAKIIKMLQVREMCVCELRAALDLAQPRCRSTCGYWRRQAWWNAARTAPG
jgi:hypothetical protein